MSVAAAVAESSLPSQLLPLAAGAQQPAMPVVGFVSGMSSSASERQAAAFLKGLSETGYLEGQKRGCGDR